MLNPEARKLENNSVTSTRHLEISVQETEMLNIPP